MLVKWLIFSDSLSYFINIFKISTIITIYSILLIILNDNDLFKIFYQFSKLSLEYEKICKFSNFWIYMKALFDVNIDNFYIIHNRSLITINIRCNNSSFNILLWTQSPLKVNKTSNNKAPSKYNAVFAYPNNTKSTTNSSILVLVEVPLSMLI